MSERQLVSDEIKQAALVDLVLMSPAAVAAKYGINPATVRKWKSRELRHLVTNVTEKSARLQALFYEYLEANLNAQIAQAYVVTDPAYIERQPAGELATLHGVLNDKLIRAVDALRPVVATDDPDALDDLG